MRASKYRDVLCTQSVRYDDGGGDHQQNGCHTEEAYCDINGMNMPLTGCRAVAMCVPVPGESTWSIEMRDPSPSSPPPPTAAAVNRNESKKRAECCDDDDMECVSASGGGKKAAVAESSNKNEKMTFIPSFTTMPVPGDNRPCVLIKVWHHRRHHHHRRTMRIKTS